LSFHLKLLSDRSTDFEDAIPRFQPATRQPSNPSKDWKLAYPQATIVAITRHWLWHAFENMRRIWPRGVQEVIDVCLQEHVTHATSPALGIVAIITFIDRVIHATTQQPSALAESVSVTARRALRAYATMVPILQEACVCLCTLAAPWQTNRLGIETSLKRLQESLDRLVTEAGLAGVRVITNDLDPSFLPSPLYHEFPRLVADDGNVTISLSSAPTSLFKVSSRAECCRHDVRRWHHALQHEFPAVLRQRVPLVTDDPFPNLDIFPPPLGDPDDDQDDGYPIRMSSIECIAALTSWIARSLIATATITSSSSVGTALLQQQTIMSDFALSAYMQMRPRLVDMFNSFVIGDLAHCDQKAISALKRIAAYLGNVLDRIADIGGSNGMYSYQKGKEVSPMYIAAEAWMPCTAFRFSNAIADDDDGPRDDHDADIETEPVLTPLAPVMNIDM
jgi:hypothetical protein